MPIVIKEIIVRTTVERQVSVSALSPEAIRQLKEMVVKEMERKQRNKEKWIGER